MTNFQQAFDRVQSLVDAFSRNRVTLRAPSYQEAEVRKDFIDPFFSALGWDVGHEFQKNPYEQEVRVERRVLGADSRISRRADYAFYVRPNFKDARFFVEAKKPARDLNNADDYFQTARYGWSAQAPISVLTDFEEFHVIDCRQQPQINSALGLGLDRFSFEDYAKEETFRRIYHVFSREAMEEDAIARYLSQKPEPRGRVVQWGLFSGGYQPIDDSFLGYLDELRRRLARAFKSRNPELDSRELTEVTQRTIDRLIFIRFLEDRLIEPEPIVRELAARGPGGWAEFVRTCRRLNAKYNGIVFRHHFSDEPRFEGADPDIFQRICAELSDSTSPYNFDAFPVHILGSIYERFLGHVVEATPTIARVVEKPEVRKAGGVYYTPSYISHHIVGDTVGRLIDGKSPKQIAKMRFADIACGSGSFLIDVFDTLLTYHGGWYQEHPEQAKRQGCHYDAEEGLWRLSLAQKRGILENCVYGVDVDDQAVEVAQMSLYIKLLESETTASANELQVLFKEKILPDLSKNVVSGNSLVDIRLAQGGLSGEDLAAEVKRLNPLDFAAAFPEVMATGGFDAIVGNPPYVRLQTLRELAPRDVDLYKQRYRAARVGNFDLYTLFVERGLELLNDRGLLGFILPHKFFTASYGRPLRDLLSSGRHVRGIVDFGHQQVFKDASTYTCLLTLSKAETKEIEHVRVESIPAWRDRRTSASSLHSTSALTAAPWHFVSGPAAGVFERLKAFPVHVGDVADRIAQGIRTSANEIYVLDLLDWSEEGTVAARQAEGRRVELEEGAVMRFLRGEDIKRYELAREGQVVVVPYRLEDGRARLIPEEELAAAYPLAYEYLSQSRPQLEERERGKMRGPGWYGYVYPKNLAVMKRPKLVVPDVADRASFALDADGSFALASGYGLTLPDDAPVSLGAMLALLNSELMTYFVRRVSTPLKGGYFRYFAQHIAQLPLPGTPEEPIDAKAQASLASLAAQVESARAHLRTASTDRDRRIQQRLVEAHERQIDEEVYRLYSLSTAEVEAVRDALRGAAPPEEDAALAQTQLFDLD